MDGLEIRDMLAAGCVVLVAFLLLVAVHMTPLR